MKKQTNQVLVDTQSKGIVLGEEPYMGKDCRIKNSHFGFMCEIGERCLISNTSFDDYSYIGRDSDVSNTSIGKFCSIASNVRINPGNHPLERVSSHHFTYRGSYYGMGEDDTSIFKWRTSKPVTIGHDVWIGHGAVILAGVSIGNGACVGAGSIVTKDVPPYSIVVGNPARLLRQRFTDEQITNLEKLAWWDWSYAEIKDAFTDFQNMPVSEFLAKYSKGQRF